MSKHPLTAWRESQSPAVTQQELATLVGVTRWTINSIETGRRFAGRDLIEAISTATGGEVGFEAFVAPKLEKAS